MNFLAKVIGWCLIGLVTLAVASMVLAVFVPSLSHLPAGLPTQSVVAELNGPVGWDMTVFVLSRLLPMMAAAGIVAFGFLSILRWKGKRCRNSGFAQAWGALIVTLGAVLLAFLTFVYVQFQPNPSRVWEGAAVVMVDPSSEQLIGWKLAGIPLGFLWLVLFYGLVSLFRMAPAPRSAEDDEEIHLMQEIHSGLGRMETRVNSLETILVDAEKESPVR